MTPPFFCCIIFCKYVLGKCVYMEFNEKLQELRKQKNLTQEELAQKLYVSRTAVSKWESGRGYPNIDSLKAIAKFFSITVDDLLSGEELLVAAQEDQKEKQKRLHSLVFGLFDLCAVALLFLPFFGTNDQGPVLSVSLINLTGISSYLKLAYYDFVSSSCLVGVLLLALQDSRWKFWIANKNMLSVILSIYGVLLFTISTQPYAAVFLFLFLVIKVLLLVKRH